MLFDLAPRPVRFTVPGVPIPQGSMKAVPDGKGGARLVPDNRRTKPWRAQIRKVADLEGIDPREGPLRVSLRFMLPRPKGHRGANGLRLAAPAYPATRPDIDKLARAVLDALTGVAYTDDGQVAELIVLKHYASSRPGVDIRIEAMA